MKINLWGGPGCGKTSVASGIFYHMKNLKMNVELVSEYIKTWAYEKKNTQSYDQLYVFAKQLRTEDLFLRNGVDHIITDSPVPMQIYYARKYNFDCWKELLNIAKSFDSKTKSINIFLDRTGIDYENNGRFENEIEAKEADCKIYEFMTQFTDSFTVIKTTHFDEIISYVLHQIE
jgi:hypothetical protein